MKLKKTNVLAIRRARETLQRFDEYRNRLAKYVNAVSGESNATYASRPPLFLLTHFADSEAAQSIITQSEIRTNTRGYISFSALSPLEFKSVTTSKRKFGFGFFVDDLKKFGLYTPVAYNDSADIASKLQQTDSSLAERVLCEPTDTQDSISFLNQMEVRTNSTIPLDCCAVFFRNEDLPSVTEKLNNAGIFQMPFTAEWYRDHFLGCQMWYMRQTEDSIEFFDNRVCRYGTGDVLGALSELAKDA